jgi:hypothetical protein
MRIDANAKPPRGSAGSAMKYINLDYYPIANLAVNTILSN